jgi:excisionase family DNA binding protein
MQAYATAERPAKGEAVYLGDSTSPSRARQAPAEAALLDQLLGRLADLVAERLMEPNGVSTRQADWMDARSAAAYLGIHRDTLRKLAAQRAIPVHQDGPRCKLYFRRDELDDWRGSTPAALRAVA